jgi:hypothetical protein
MGDVDDDVLSTYEAIDRKLMWERHSARAIT